MGYLYQTPSGIADPNKMTISMWCRIPTYTGPAAPILMFGDEGGWVGQVQVNPNSFIFFKCYGAYQSYDVAANTVAVNFGTYPTFDTFTPALDIVTYASGHSAFETGHQPEIAFDKWFHLLIAADLSTGSTATWDGAKVVANTWATVWVYINGVRVPIVNRSVGTGRVRTIGDNPYGGSNINYVPGASSGAMWTVAVDDDSINSDIGPGYGVFDDTGSHVAGDSYTINIPTFNVALNGFSIALPGMSWANAPAVDYGDVQVWFGTYIDPTVSANFAKFVSISGGVGVPVNPATAAAAFGTQTLLFQGNAASFATNRGNGGAFTTTGTVSDFTPGPTY